MKREEQVKVPLSEKTRSEYSQGRNLFIHTIKNMQQQGPDFSLIIQISQAVAQSRTLLASVNHMQVQEELVHIFYF